jgi:hypothetical protein
MVIVNKIDPFFWTPQYNIKRTDAQCLLAGLTAFNFCARVPVHIISKPQHPDTERTEAVNLHCNPAQMSKGALLWSTDYRQKNYA